MELRFTVDLLCVTYYTIFSSVIFAKASWDNYYNFYFADDEVRKLGRGGGGSPRDYTEPDTWEAPRPGLIFSGTIKNFLPPFLLQSSAHPWTFRVFFQLHRTKFLIRQGSWVYESFTLEVIPRHCKASGMCCMKWRGIHHRIRLGVSYSEVWEAHT